MMDPGLQPAGATPFGKLCLGSLAAFLIIFGTTTAFADKVIMKDGAVYKGKIILDTDKGVLIGNPPFDPDQYLLKSEDIDTIVYEEYHLSPPAERRRGLAFETRLSGNIFSSNELSLSPAAGLYGGSGFRMHPLFEIDGGINWLPELSSSNGLSITDTQTTRSYQRFWEWSGSVVGRLYPLGQRRSLKLEPFLLGGYEWAHILPKDTGDSLKGAGWQIGAGLLYPLNRNFFLDGQFVYHNLTFDQVDFNGRSGSISPQIMEHQYSFSLGLSYRL